MNTLIMAVFAGAFLMEIVLTTSKRDSRRFFILHGFRVPENSSRLTGKRNAIGCCVECLKIPTCKAVNFHTGDKVCELLEPGTSLLYPKASIGWTFCYTDSKHLYHFFNAIASQKTTWYDSVRERAMDGFAELGIDGNTNSHYFRGSCFCTGRYTSLPWWMVDLFVNFRVESVIMWNRLDHYCGKPCYDRLKDLIITVSRTQSGVDDPDNVCATYPGPPSSSSENPVVVKCNRAMVGRYIKILKNIHEFVYFHLCEFDFA